jgi:ATP-dependent Clp protease protease subunit
VKKIEKDTDRDFYMTPEEALKYGLIDEIVKKSDPVTKKG